MDHIDVSMVKPSSKVPLHDGEKRVRKVSVMGIMRSCEAYLEYAFKAFTNMEELYDVAFEYYFLENNSTDRTRDMLLEWIDGRDGNVLVYNLTNDYGKTSHGMDHKRTSTLAMLRNKLVDTVTPLNSEWTIMLDSNIYFDPQVIGSFFDAKPATNGYGMMGGFAHQLYPPSVLNANVQKSLDTAPNKLVSVHHYYDTFSLVDIKGKHHYPNCPFKKCKLCQTYSKGVNRDQIDADQNVVEVMSCVGGLAVIDSTILNDSRIRWQSISYEPKMDISLCEHVLFCDRLRTITSKKIVILQNVDRIFRTE
jgi:hypothetical protein